MAGCRVISGWRPGRSERFWNSTFYPPSNGKVERWHRSLKGECLRPGVPGSVEEARHLLASYMDHYNRVPLHSAIGYVTPQAKLEGREQQIFAERARKLEEDREQMRLRRQQGLDPSSDPAGDSSTAGLN